MVLKIGVLAACAFVLAAPAEARKAPRYDSRVASHCVFDNSGRQTCGGSGNRILVRDANGNRTQIVGRRPKGCPHKFCGCEASLYLFGKIKPELNLALNWIRKFPRTSPAPGMAAARPGHVMVLISQIDGKNWLVHDGNSGGGLTRRHVRSIVGYTIVNPHGAVASR